MARVKRGVAAHAKHKKVLDSAKGFHGRRKNTIRVAKQAVEKSLQYAYRDRKNRKRTFRALCHKPRLVNRPASRAAVAVCCAHSSISALDAGPPASRAIRRAKCPR